MEYINKIELQGRVGTVRTNVVGETKVANISLVTELLHKTRDGGATNEITWHQIVVWEGRDMPNLDLITKGSVIRILGRMRSSRYTASDGSERQISEVVANKLVILEEENI